MQRLELPPSLPSILVGLGVSVIYQAERAGSAEEIEEAGEEIRRQIGDRVPTFEEGVIPEELDFKDITPHMGETPTKQYVVRYTPKNNQSYIVARIVGRVEDSCIDPHVEFHSLEEEAPRYVPLPQNEQSEEVIRPLTPAEWVKHGPNLVVKLGEMVQKAQSTKEQ